MRAAFALAIFTAASAAVAAPIRMDLTDAMRRAEQAAPALAVRRVAARASRDLAHAADQKLSHPPRIEIEVGPRFRSDPSRVGVDATLGAWQDFPLGGLGASRRAWASAVGSEADARLDVTKHDVRAEAALTWIEARLARELMRIRKQSHEHALAIAKVVGLRVRAGSTPPSDEATAKALVGAARAEVIDAEGRAFVAETALRHLTGTRGRELVISGPLETSDRPLKLAPLLMHAGAQPDLRAADAVAERAERAADLARSAGKPSLSIGPSVTREATGDWIVLGRASFPLPLVNPGALESARAQAEARGQRAEAQHARATLAREIELGLHERQHARELRDALRGGVIGPAREALRQTLAQYEAGNGDTATVLSARRELLLAEERWAEAAADVRRADVRLMRLLGRDPAELSERAQP